MRHGWHCGSHTLGEGLKALLLGMCCRLWDLQQGLPVEIKQNRSSKCHTPARLHSSSGLCAIYIVMRRAG